MPIKVKLVLEAIHFGKKNWPYIVAALILLILGPFFIINAAITSMFSWLDWDISDPDRVGEYKMIAEQKHLNWMEMMAIDLAKNHMDQDKLSPKSVAEDFIYEVEVVVPVYKTETIEVCTAITCYKYEQETDEIDHYETQIEIRIRSFEEVIEYLGFDADEADLARNTLALIRDEMGGSPSNDPIAGRQLIGWSPCQNVSIITSGFGYRLDPIKQVTKLHKGIDIGCPMYTPVLAYEDGTVQTVLKPEQSGGYGNYIIIQHGGELRTAYAHLQTTLVKPFQQIKKNTIIGYSGSTGDSTGPHLHFEMYQIDTPVDPLNFLSIN